MSVWYPVYQPSLNGNEKKYILDCLDTNWISSRGSYIGRFEKEFARYTETEHATTVCNGTAAVFLSLVTLGIQPGDEIILPSLVYIAVPNMVMACGAIPVFTDSLPGSWQMDPDDIRRRITSKTKAVIAVHNYGHPCDMDPISQICKEHGLFLVEDCAEALGAKYKGKHVGHWGDLSVYSFFGNKTITTGEGGMLTSHSSELIAKAAHLKNQGVTGKTYWHDVHAYNFRMTNLNAAIGLAQLEGVEDKLSRKRQIADLYEACFRNSPYEFHRSTGDVIHSYWMCSVLVPKNVIRDVARDFLTAEGIETRPFFYPAHTMPVYRHLNAGPFPIAEDLGARGINLPSYPGLSDEDVRFIASKVLTFTGH